MGRRGGNAHRQGLGVECFVWKCRHCDLVFPNPMPIPVGGLDQHYALEGDDYFRNHNPSDMERRAGLLLGQAETLIGRKGALLDIGSGRGEMLKVAVTGGWEAVGIEPSPTFASLARQSGAKIWEVPIEDFNLPNESFDVIILQAVLEHLYDPDATIAAISRCLKPKGVLFVNVPNESGIYFLLGNLYHRLRGRDWVINLAPTFPPFHTFGFSPRSLRRLLAKHGLYPSIWRVYGRRDMLPVMGGASGKLEQIGSRVVIALSQLGSLGQDIDTWARKE